MKHFIGVRLNDEEKQILELLSHEFKQTPSKIIRKLLNESQANAIPLKNLLKEVKEQSDENCQQLRKLEELARFTASLLAGLTRKSSKSDPTEGEKLIQIAKQEAGAFRDGKGKPGSGKGKTKNNHTIQEIKP